MKELGAEGIEEAVLSLIINEPKYYGQVDLTIDHFVTSGYRDIWAAITAVGDQGKDPSMVNVELELRDQGKYAGVGGRDALIDITMELIDPTQLDSLCDKLEEWRQKRELQACCIKTQAALEDNQALERTLSWHLDSLRGLNNWQRQGSSSISAILNKNMKEIEDETFERHSIKCGLEPIDDLTGGFEPGNVVIIAGGTGMGKTVVLTQMALHMAYMLEHPTVLHSLEMSGREMGRRVLSMMSEIGFSRIRANMLSKAERKSLCGLSDDLSSSPFHIDTTGLLTTKDVYGRARRAQLAYGLECLLIDYLQLLTPVRSTENRVADVDRIARELKNIATELKILLVAGSQLSRKPEGRQDKHPRLSDLRESGAIEQNADVVISLFRPGFYYPKASDANMIDIEILKNRNGPTGRTRMVWDGACVKVKRWNPAMADNRPGDGGEYPE